MPKRSHKDDANYLKRKLRRIEKKLEKCKKRLHDSSHNSSESGNDSLEPVLLDSELEHEDESQPVHELVPRSVDKNLPGTSTANTEGAVGASLQAKLRADSLSAADPPELDEEILILLGEMPSKDKKYGPDIRSELAVRWEHIATTGLSEDSKKELLERHLVPKNCKKIDAPMLNPEIKAALSDILIKKDKALETKQKQVAASISCISEALTRLFSLEHRDQSVIKLLIEAGQLICDSQHSESRTRRSIICSTIKKDIKDQLFDTEIDGFLFGEKLAETLKPAKAISKSGAELKIHPPVRKTPSAQKPRAAPTQALNQKPPLPTARQAGAARRFEPAATASPRAHGSRSSSDSRRARSSAATRVPRPGTFRF